MTGWNTFPLSLLDKSDLTTPPTVKPGAAGVSWDSLRAKVLHVLGLKEVTLSSRGRGNEGLAGEAPTGCVGVEGNPTTQIPTLNMPGSGVLEHVHPLESGTPSLTS